MNPTTAKTRTALTLPVMSGQWVTVEIRPGESIQAHLGSDGKHRARLAWLVEEAECDTDTADPKEMADLLGSWLKIVASDRPADGVAACVSPPQITRTTDGIVLFGHHEIASLAGSYLNAGAWGYTPAFLATGARLAEIATALARADAAEWEGSPAGRRAMCAA